RGKGAGGLGLPSFTNDEIAGMLKDVAAALRMRGADRFQPAAYDRAARGVATHPDSLARLWEAGRLRNVAGVGGSIAQHLDELFRTGRVAYWDDLLSGIPEVIFELLRIPGVGQVTAWNLARAGVEDLEDLERRLEAGTLVAAGFREKQLAGIAAGLAELNRRPDRMLLPVAESLAAPLLAALCGFAGVVRADVLGSLRRRTATQRDLNFGVATEAVEPVLAALRGLPTVLSVTRDGDHAASLMLHGGQPVDVRFAPPERYGVTQIWFTGSAAHVGRLAHRAIERGLRLTPDGLFDEADNPVPTLDEASVYRALGLAVPPPELREDRGEFEAVELPPLVTGDDLRGDCHTHTRWSDGRDTLLDMLEAIQAHGHQYAVITDHSYPNMDFIARVREIDAARRLFPKLQIVNGLEVNITVEGGLQVPDDVLSMHQFCLASIHTGFRQPREVITGRLLAALRHPSINGIAHPTGRLLLRREGIDTDWDAVFDECLRQDKFLEIDGPPDRLDLPDVLVREAVRRGVKLTIDSDAHATGELSHQVRGIDVAQRGWAEPQHILNTRPWSDFAREAHVRGI
ncbi:MAG: PHP domain-containing protein, partial [Dehalococcoidia bacterium]